VTATRSQSCRTGRGQARDYGWAWNGRAKVEGRGEGEGEAGRWGRRATTQWGSLPYRWRVPPPLLLTEDGAEALGGRSSSPTAKLPLNAEADVALVGMGSPNSSGGIPETNDTVTRDK
jgi:hypothetical protein